MDQQNAGRFIQGQKPFLLNNNVIVKLSSYKDMGNKILNIFCTSTCAIFFLVFDSADATTLDEKGVCRPEEQIVFSCLLGKKTASVCASIDVSKESGYMQYRFGSNTHTDMLYPKSLEQSNQHFFISSVSYAGGGETHLRFSVNQYDYIIFDRTLRGDRDSEGRRNPISNSGIVIKKNGKKIQQINCINEKCAGIRPVAYDVLKEERYEDLELR